MDSSPLEDALSLNTESLPASVSPVAIVESDGLVVAQRCRTSDRAVALVAYRGAQGEARTCRLECWSLHRRRIHHQVWRWSAAPTATVTAAEQLLVVSDSRQTPQSTQAP